MSNLPEDLLVLPDTILKFSPQRWDRLGPWSLLRVWRPSFNWRYVEPCPFDQICVYLMYLSSEPAATSLCRSRVSGVVFGLTTVILFVLQLFSLNILFTNLGQLKQHYPHFTSCYGHISSTCTRTTSVSPNIVRRFVGLLRVTLHWPGSARRLYTSDRAPDDVLWV